MITLPEVFIIESLSREDEDTGRFEGQIISGILNLGGKQSEYYYIRTVQELEEFVDVFYESKYRYLHFSCHGSKNFMHTTFDSIDFERLKEILQPCIHERRIFFSACTIVNDNLARHIFPDSDCYSIIGPSQEVAFNDSAILWASFYHLMFKQDLEKMKRKEILDNCKNIAKLFEVPLNYYSPSRNSPDGFKLTHIDAYGHSVDKTLKKSYTLTEKKEEHSMAYERWTEEQDKELSEKYQSGIKLDELATHFQRNTGAIRSRLRKLGLKH